MEISNDVEELTDITLILEDAASLLKFESSMLYTESFNLQDSMAALEIMDKKMDCCEVSCRKENPKVRNDHNETKIEGESKTETNERIVFPRPAPTGLNDEVDPLPWDELTLEDAVFIVTENLVRLESFLTDGSSVVESIFTSLYAHSSVMEDMKIRLESSSLAEKMQDMMATKRRGTLPQYIVYSSTLMLIELTELLRGVILNADIYEEEDFTVSTYNIKVYDDRDDVSVVQLGHEVLSMVQQKTIFTASNNRDILDPLVCIRVVLGFQLDFISLITSMARLSGKFVREELTKSQITARAAVAKASEISAFIKDLRKVQSNSSKIVIKQTFDSNVNRPLVGNAPIRKIVFREAEESVPILKNIVGEIDRVVCNILLKGNTIGRIRCMMRDVSAASANILARSLLVLNLYFDDKIFGQYMLPDLIVGHLKQLSGIPDSVFSGASGAHAFLNRLCKPIYDTLKVLALNRNRQRSYIDVMLGDWSALREEAYIVDTTYHQDNRGAQELQPHFSLYVLSLTIELMDNFVGLGVELELLCNEEELAVAYWYRDFLTSSLLSQIGSMRQGKLKARQLQLTEQSKKQINQNQHQSTNKSHKPGRKKGKTKKNASNNNNNSEGSVAAQPALTAEDLEDEFDFMLFNVKRSMCRGLVRFFAAVRQAGITPELQYEFTTNQRIFEKRFEVFSGIIQPPPLGYEDYLKGSDFSKVSQRDLLASTGDSFRMSKSMIERLLTQIPLIDPNYLPAQEAELKQLAKVCVGNSIYLQKLIQVIDGKGESEARIAIDTTTNSEFCTIKIH